MAAEASEGVADAHCDTCRDYERQVMEALPGQPAQVAVAPCPAYSMSDRFRDHLVAQMQREMSGLVSASGLDRMAILRARR